MVQCCLSMISTRVHMNALSCGALSSERGNFLKSFDGLADVFGDNGAIKANFPVDDKIIYCNFSHIEFFLVILLQFIADSSFLMHLHSLHYIILWLTCYIVSLGGS